MAGFGKRMRPHTWSKPKPLINVAGKTLLDHVLDRMAPIGFEEVVFIVGWLGDQVRDHVAANYDFSSTFVVQEELAGQAHAIQLAGEYLHGPCVVAWVDTICEADVTGLDREDADIVAFVKSVDDPRPFGVVVERDGRVVQFIEKPDNYVHRKVVVGLYYIRDSQAMLSAINYLVTNGIQTKGEFYLTDALQIMIDRGAKVVTRPVRVWEDCGNPKSVLQTNRYLLDLDQANSPHIDGCLIVPPVHVASTAHIENSVIGPYAVVSDGTTISNAALRDCIVGRDAAISNVALKRSLVGNRSRIRGALAAGAVSGQSEFVGPYARLNVGDDADVNLKP